MSFQGKQEKKLFGGVLNTYSKEENNQVAADEGDKDAQVSPSQAIIEVQVPIELITLTIRAVLTILRVFIHQVSKTTVREELSHVLATRHVVRGLEGVELVR